MPNQILKNVRVTTQTSWSGTNGARPAIVISPQAGLKKLLPVSATFPVVPVAPVGTVVVLCQDAGAMTSLRRSLAGLNVVIQHHGSLDAILGDQQPPGPACLIVDLDDSETANLDFYEQFKSKGWHLPAIILVRNPEVRMVVRLMRAGVADVLLKSCGPGELIAAINNCLHHSAQRMRHRARINAVQRRLAQLTAREAQIVKFLLAGKINKEIAARLQVALITVKVHRASIMRKLGARSGVELARLILMATGPGSLDFASGRTGVTELWPEAARGAGKHP